MTTFDLTTAQKKALLIMLADDEIIRDARSESWSGRSKVKVRFRTIISLFDRRLALIQCNRQNSRRKVPTMSARLTAIGGAVARELRSNKRIQTNRATIFTDGVAIEAVR